MKESDGMQGTIRLAREDDVAAAQRVIVESLRSFGYEVSPEFDGDFADLLGFYRSSGGEFFVLEVPGSGVVGTVAVGGRSGGVCILRRMYLDERFQGQGFGRQLLEHAMTWARNSGYTRMELETAPNMQAAMKLYESLGFTCDGPTQRFGRAGVSFSRELVPFGRA